jgi:hypothetical protein
MGAVSSGRRLSYRVYDIASDSYSADTDGIASRRVAASGSAEGGIGASSEAGYPPGLPPFSGGLLVEVFPRTKEDRGLAPYPEFETIEQVYQANQIQDGDSRHDPSYAHQEHMGSMHRSI